MGGSLESETWVPGLHLVLNPTWDWLQNFCRFTKHPQPRGLLRGSCDDFHPNDFLDFEVGAGREPQGLEDTCLQCWWGAAIWPSCLSDQNSRSCLCREKSVAPAALKVMLAWIFFSFSWSGRQKLVNIPIPKGEVSFHSFSQRGYFRRWELLLP